MSLKCACAWHWKQHPTITRTGLLEHAFAWGLQSLCCQAAKAFLGKAHVLLQFARSCSAVATSGQ